MIEPALADDALLADIHAAADRANELHLWWLGQSGFLLHWNDCYVLMDPYLSESLTRKYAATSRPHIRMTRRPIDPARLDRVQLVTCSHEHTDHLDADTILPLLSANPQLQIVVPAAIQELAARRLLLPPRRLHSLDAGETLELAKARIEAVPAAHEALEHDDAGRCRYLGYLLTLGGWSIYHAGDTVCYPGMEELLQRRSIDVALLPINGRDPTRGVPGNLSGEEAAELAHRIGARMAIPCHYAMFTFNTVSVRPFVAAAAQLGQAISVLQCGERWTALVPDTSPSPGDT